MDNNVPSCLSTPHKAHYIPSSSSSSDHQYHHHHHQFYQHQQYLMNASLHYSQTPHLALNLNDDVEPPQNDTTNTNNNNETDDDDDNDADAGDGDEEPMFEKPLTPSDVGKLNRLVIPKQHAEKYFPLGGGGGGGGGGDSAAGEKGLLLSFEDESGKAWRFRYSYWNSSQSYVLTKGWSRYVKEKRLDAGDVVLFKRHRRHADRLFIGWRRRAAESSAPAQGSGRGVYGAPRAYPAPPGGGGVAVPYQPDCVHAGLLSAAQSQTTTLGNININNINNNNNNNSNSSSTSNNNSSKILRLFGVNLECHNNEQSSEPSTPDGSSLSSHGQAHHHQFYPSSNYYSDHQYHDHMDFTFSRDVNPMRNRRG